MANSGIEKTIDIQYLSLLVNHLYQKHDKKVGALKLSGIQKLDRCPELTAHNGPVGPDAEKSTTQYNLCMHPRQQEPSAIHSFFPTDLQLSQIEKENIYWRIRLMYGCSVLPIILIYVIRGLKQLGYTNLSAKIEKDGMVVEEKIDFDNVTLRLLRFKPKEYHIVNKFFVPGMEALELIEIPSGDTVVHNFLMCNDTYVLDLTGMQFGMRGKYGELVGRLESLPSFLKRFPGEIVYVQPERSSKSQEEYDVQGQFKLNQFCIEPTIEDVLRHLRQGSVWCFYCGRNSDSLKKCTACSQVMYCGRDCQKSDWKGHKRICKRNY